MEWLRDMPKFVVYFCAMVNGVLLGATTFFSYLAFLAPLCIALWLFQVRRAERREALLFGQLFGFGLLAAVFSWGFTTLPLNWLGISDPLLGLGIITFIWGIYSFILATPIASLSAIVHMLRGWWLVLVPCLWVVAEVVRAFLFSITTWGSGTTIGADFSFGYIGYALAWIPGTLHLAAYGGVYILSALCVALGVLVYILIESGVRFRSIALSYSVVTALLWIIPSPIHTILNPGILEVGGLRIALPTTEFKPVLARTGFEVIDKELRTAALLEELLTESPNIIVLPEYSSYFKTEEFLDEATRARIRSALAENDVLLIDSERTSETLTGGILFYDGKKKRVVETQYKRFMIPLGEFMPTPLIVLARTLGLSEEIDAVLAARTYAPSKEPFSSRILEWKGVRISVLACSEVFSPVSYTSVSRAGADVLINIASHSWVRGSAPILFNETMAMARVHAVFTGKPYLQASNYAPSFALLPR